MYRLLIVDDEPVIVDSMNQLFREAVHLDIEIYRAYTVYEAMDHLRQNRIDVVLSDIRMPGLSGIELQQQMMNKWPRCKIIFLTGHNDFEYARQAIRNGGVSDYLLKHEDDDIILQAVERAFAAIDKQALSDSYVLQTREKLQLALSAAQKNALFDLSYGIKPPSPEELAQKFEQLEMPLRADRPVFQIIGRADNWDPDGSEWDRGLLAFAIQNIVDEVLGSAAVCVSIGFEYYKFLWLIQPLEDSLASLESGAGREWELLTSQVHGLMEYAQSSCKKALKVSVSFAVSHEPVEWAGFGTQFNYLRMLLGQGFDGKQELLIQENHMPVSLAVDKNLKSLAGSQRLRKQLGQLEEYLESGHRKEFDELYSQIMNREVSSNPAYVLELFHSVSLCLLSYANRTGLFHILSSKMNTGKMTRYDAHENWEDIVQYFMDVAGLMFDNRPHTPEAGTQRTIQIIQHYVHNHLEQELTLTKLAAFVNHSPAYLSRLYKKETGVTLSDFITECRMTKSKVLLAETAMKIHKIAAVVGYESPPQFTRSFKKWFKVTPQEYRETFQKLES